MDLKERVGNGGEANWRDDFITTVAITPIQLTNHISASCVTANTEQLTTLLRFMYGMLHPLLT
ncbi:hypothetical protein E2C01_018209 [Portunus trituberculatus]|uniref:Uncharacterized protein n=1 Tax=Portunus trituberculatus TaxID=210409 RepID=A0A5B7DUH2_PORTR|nr:hypothetical protein [Portunus trituberculatus]